MLKSAFPRIFAFTVKEDGRVNEYGFCSNNNWSWKIFLRRRLFRWELNRWDDFCVILKGFIMCESLKDSLIWKRTSSGQYSTNQFCKYVIKSGSSNLEWWKLVWLKLAPPEVEVFCWQLMKGRIAMKE